MNIIHKIVEATTKASLKFLEQTKGVIGTTKGYWTVVRVSQEGLQKSPRVWVQCKCGHHRAKPFTLGEWEKVSEWSSCGCLMEAVKTDPELAKKFSEHTGNTSYHGMGNTSLFRSWRKMRCRCNNEKEKAYRFYGALGIRVCKEWDHSGGFIAFMEWALAHGWKEGMEINRIDHTGDYTPDNCNWMTKHDNLMEMHSRVDRTKYITIRDITLPQATWLKLSGVTYNMLRDRVTRKGMSEEQALALPKRSQEEPTEAHVEALVNKALVLNSPS